MIKFNDYRIKYLALNKNRVCEKCGTIKNLQVHHINKHHSDNRIENLMLVCPECHRELHKGDRIYNIMSKDWVPHKRERIPFWRKIYLDNVAKTKQAVRNTLKNRIFNIDKERLERIYFRLGGNAGMIYEKRNSQQVMN